jgi:hypothetical protein
MNLFKSDQRDEYGGCCFTLKGTGDRDLQEARERFKKIDYRDCNTKYSDRPFDTRYICYSPVLEDRPRKRFMSNFAQPNLQELTFLSLSQFSAKFRLLSIPTEPVKISVFSFFRFFRHPFATASNIRVELCPREVKRERLT